MDVYSMMEELRPYITEETYDLLLESAVEDERSLGPLVRRTVEVDEQGHEVVRKYYVEGDDIPMWAFDARRFGVPYFE